MLPGQVHLEDPQQLQQKPLPGKSSLVDPQQHPHSAFWQDQVVDPQEHQLLILAEGPHQVVFQQLLQPSGHALRVGPQHLLQHSLLAPHYEQGSREEVASFLLQV